jgi:GH15 family glucan-1,4-alpha-glucosidase
MQQLPGYVRATVGNGAEPRYWPVAQYGAIGDCRTAALVAPNGSIDWLCLPHFDSPAVFLRLLDAERGGFFRISPVGETEASMTYLPNTNILETTFRGAGGRLRLVDFMPIRKRSAAGQHGRLHLGGLLRRRPVTSMAPLELQTVNDVAAAHRIARLATCLEGSVEVELTLRATFDYARAAPEIAERALPSGMVGAILRAGERYLVFIAREQRGAGGDEPPIRLERAGDMLRVRLRLHAGQGLVAAVNYARTLAEATTLLTQLTAHPFERDLDETRLYWREWAASCSYDGTYQYAMIRSALALKLCTFEPTGAIVAAPTTSLPEQIGGVRNWDYRYTWLRDSAFTLGALVRLGYLGEARDYFHFLNDLQIQSGADLRIMYGIRGEIGEPLEERDLGHLEGYQGSRPVRVGNGAAMQRQLDVYGELLDAAYQYEEHEGFTRLAGHSKRDLRTLSRVVAEYVAGHWQEPDRGIWEVRGEPSAFVYSRVMCWLALDRACRLAERQGHHVEKLRWETAQLAIANDVVTHGYDPQLESFVQAYGSRVLDAANLRMGMVDFLPWEDPRIAGTVAAIQRYLSGPHGLVYRYRLASDGLTAGHAATGGGITESEINPADGLPGAEGTFLACAFWLVENLCHLGQVEEARERFEALLQFASPLGLFSEEVDPATGLALGNYPQAFTHIGLVNSAVALQKAQEGTLPPHPGLAGL